MTGGLRGSSDASMRKVLTGVAALVLGVGLVGLGSTAMAAGTFNVKDFGATYNFTISAAK